MRLNPEVLDRAKVVTGSRSDEQLGQAFLDRTGMIVRNWRKGKSVPDLGTLGRLQEITNWPLDDMVLRDDATPDAA